VLGSPRPRERKVAYLLYEKGRTLLSVFVVPVSSRDAKTADPVGASQSPQYMTQELKGFRIVWWREGGAVFALVSALDPDAVLECAGRWHLERRRGQAL
jgi:hypothetical protein